MAIFSKTVPQILIIFQYCLDIIPLNKTVWSDLQGQNAKCRFSGNLLYWLDGFNFSVCSMNSGIQSNVRLLFPGDVVKVNET
jgi:hypothetical protein